MPDPNDPSLIIDPRLGEPGRSPPRGISKRPFSESQGAPIEFGVPAVTGEAGNARPLPRREGTGPRRHGCRLPGGGHTTGPPTRA